jgi:putative restriction endonuclease
MNIRKPWEKDELLLAINLYCKTPFGKIHVRNPDIIKLAEHLNRTPGSVSYKLANFASIDPSLPRKGASNVSKLDRAVWQEFFADCEDLAFKSEKKMSEIVDSAFADIIEIDAEVLEREDTTKEQVIKSRVNQNFFRKMILASYNYRCCITGFPITELLVASHIIPWSKDEKNRLNPCNGLCLNALHDRAFDRGLISLSEDYNLIVSQSIKNYPLEETEILLRYSKAKISLPNRFLPNKNFLAYHRKEIFLS